MKDYNLINQRATTCKHGGHCEWVACDKCNHYEPDVLNQQPCEDCISRAKAIEEADKLCLETAYDNEKIIEMLNDLPSVTPKEKIGYCKDCKWWKDSDGAFRRGVGAESKCSINRKEVYEGNGYCYLFEPQEGENKE